MSFCQCGRVSLAGETFSFCPLGVLNVVLEIHTCVMILLFSCPNFNSTLNLPVALGVSLFWYACFLTLLMAFHLLYIYIYLHLAIQLYLYISQGLVVHGCTDYQTTDNEPVIRPLVFLKPVKFQIIDFSFLSECMTLFFVVVDFSVIPLSGFRNHHFLSAL